MRIFAEASRKRAPLKLYHRPDLIPPFGLWALPRRRRGLSHEGPATMASDGCGWPPMAADDRH